MDAGLKRLKVIDCGEDGGMKRVLVSGCHRDKRLSESVGSIPTQFDSKGMLGRRKLSVFYKEGFRRDY